MPQYHFHLDECGTVTTDLEGSEHDDLDAARASAASAAREIMCEELKTGHLCMGCHIDIADPAGHALHRLHFSDVVSVSGMRPK